VPGGWGAIQSRTAVERGTIGRYLASSLLCVRRLILSPRWIVWHVLTLGAMVTCGWLAAWQWQRAGSAMGSALNVGYGLQWPVFAVFFGVMWWRMLRMEAAKLEETAAATPPAEDAAPAPVPQTVRNADAPSPFGPRPRDAAPPPADDPELVAYNQMLAQLAARHSAAEPAEGR
jgi:DNA-binding transcriptional regulator of glucitol operon